MEICKRDTKKNVDIKETKTIGCSQWCEGHFSHPQLMVHPPIDNTHDTGLGMCSPVL